MAHSVIGLIVGTDYVYQICSEYPSFNAVPLEQEFSLFPLADKILTNLGIKYPVDLVNSGKLPVEFTDLLARLSVVCPLLCFETEYFGGTGNQFAIVFENGKVIFGPAKSTIGSINEGLRLLGVRRKPDYDEFDSIGLGQYRFTDDWLNKI
jgi:hypothetical protein